MDNMRLFNGFMGKAITTINTDCEAEEELMELLNLPLEEAPDYLKKLIAKLPKPIKKLKMSTIMDIILNMMDEEVLAELDKLCEEEDEG